jgi:prepilin-type N-terminal cleavage/methylation domain-containing protein
VGGASAPRDRGFTLIELMIAVAVIAMTAAAGIGISLASRSFAVTAAATEFDQFLDSARTMARDLQGATLAFAPDAYGDGTEVRLLTSGPNGTLVTTTLPVLHARVIIEETESLGQPPYAFVVHANGALGGRPGFRAGNSTSSSAEVGCPASGAFHFLIHTANASADRYVPCRVALAAAGPVALASWPPIPVVAPPTPCGSGCSPTALPTAPSSSPSCPPNFTPISGGCAPAPNPGAHYHVSASGASPSMIVGATESFTAQAILTNPGSVAPGTPASIPVEVAQTTGGVCSATPPGAQPSGTTFTLSALSAGTCVVTIAADTTGVAGSTADTAAITVTISIAPAPTPTPQGCDLTVNGKCYHRIVDQTAVTFTKYVLPDSQCSDPNNEDSCSYVNTIRTIQLTEYQFAPPVPPVDVDHELLFQIDQVQNIFDACLPFAVVATVPGNDQIPWGGIGAGAAPNSPIGFGQPSLYLTVNHVFVADGIATFNDAGPWSQGTTLAELFEAIALRSPGSEYSFTFSSSNANSTASVQWYPDFPACDVAGDPVFPGVQYGYVTVQLVFEIYQAMPQAGI